MKRTALYISSALLLIVGLCLSCQKEQNFLEEKGASVNEVIVKATIGGADTKVSFTEDGSTLKTAWENDDHIVGWDKDGNAIELEIASIDNGTAIFKTVEGSSAIPTGGKVYMIYAPGKSKSNISNKSLEYSLADQGSGKLPALMTATGEVSGNVLSLTFANQLAIVAVKNPTFPVIEATPITELTLSGSNIQTKATFSMDGETLKMESSVAGDITRTCNFTTAANGTTTETMVYFAVLPNSTAAEVTVSTTAPTGYQISFSDKSFTAGQCYLLDQKTIGKQKFTLTAGTTTNGGISFENGSETITSGSSVAWGTEVTVTAAPSEGYELTPNSIAVTGATSGSIPLTDNKFTMPKENVTVSGSFKKKDYNITADVTPSSGTYTVEGGTYTVKNSSGTDVTKAQMGDVITVTPSPADGYSGGTVTVKETTSSNPVTVTGNTFTMPAAGVTITVTFTHDTYAITGTVTPESSGTVTFKKSGSDAGIDKAYYGEKIIVEATPATGYELESIKCGTDADITSTKMFTMPAKAVTVTVTFKASGPEYVEMWMDVSGTKKLKWAKMNLGATKEAGSLSECAGDYYQWGSVETIYNTIPWSSWSGSGNIELTSDNSGIISGGFNDANKTYKGTSDLSDATNDVVRATYLGTKWRMPTSQEFKDLYDACGGGSPNTLSSDNPVKGIYWLSKDQSFITAYKGVAGLLFVDGGGNKLFFPAAGYGGTSLSYAGSHGRYWSSSLYTGNIALAYYLRFDSGNVSPQYTKSGYRSYGFPVRPVSD